MNETNRETERTAAEAAEETVNKPAARKKAPGEAKKAPARKAAKPAADAAEKKAAPRGKKAVKAAEPSLAETICAFLSSKKAEDIVILDVREKTVLCDYFVVASGRNTTQVRALCETLEDKLAESGIEPRRREGVKEGRWGVLDYGDVLVHIFNDESRLFYHLERLWGEGDNIRRWED